MNKESFLVRNLFTIVLLFVMVISAVLVISSGKTRIEGVPQLNATMIAILVVVGLAAGLLGGLIGTGGCSIMLPVLHFWLGFPAAIAVGTTLFAVIFTAISGGYGHFIRRNVDKRVTLWTGAGGIIGVIIGSWIFTFLSQKSELLGAIIGMAFLWPSFRMIWEGIKGYKQSALASQGAPASQEQSIKGHPAQLSLFGLVVGTLTGIVGLGGGYVLVPGLIYLFGAPVYITMGTSLAVMVPMALIGGSIKLAQGFVFLGSALVLGSGSIIGAQIGSAIIKKFKPNTLKLIFGLYFLYVAVKFITNYFGIHIW